MEQENKIFGARKYKYSALMFVVKDLVVSSTSLGDDCEDDYLQDPELWKDSLPQPYQLVDEILQEILFNSWQLIETRSAQREAEKSKPVIPRCNEARVLEFLSGITDIAPCSRLQKKCSAMFVTSTTGLSAIDMAIEQGDPTVLAQESMEEAQRVHSRHWRDTNKHSLVAVTMATGKLRLYILYNMQFILMTEFSNTEMEVNGKVTLSLISKQCSHLVLGIDGEDGYCTNVYGLPEEAWSAELDKLQPDSVGKPPVTFTKPTLLLHVKCPLSFQPCPHNNPATALASVTTRGAETILSSQYIENRRKAFVSQRHDFVNPHPPEKSNRRSSHFHYLYYDRGVKKSTPTQLVLWWEDDVNLLFYSLEGRTSDATSIYRWPQASTIYCSEVNIDSSLLAVGLTSGCVALWNLVTYQHVGMVWGCSDVCSLLFIQSHLMTSSRPKHTSSTSFTSSNKQALLLGCSDGSLHVADCIMPSSLPIKLASSTGMMDAITALLVTPALPELVACLQKNNTLVLQNTLTGEAVCELQLPSPSSFQPDTLCFTSSGNVMFVGSKGNESYLHMFQLNQVESLQNYWEEGHTQEPKPQPYSGQIELLTDLLENYLMARKNATPERQQRSQQRWKELSTEVAVISQLKKQTRQSQLIRALRRRSQATT